MGDLEFTGERLTTTLGPLHGVIEHLHRYGLAQEIAADKIVLDIASGEGYGSFILSKSAKYVYGVDIDDETIAHSREKYSSSKNLEFKKGSTSSIPLPDHSVDVVISFETIEHHDQHEEMMVEIVRVLKEDGVLLISTPEKSIYSQRDPNNEFHIKELTLGEFKQLAEKHFKFNNFFYQRFVIGSLIHAIESDTKSKFQMFDGNYSSISIGLEEDDYYNKPYFNLALCSNASLDKSQLSQFSLFNGVNVVKTEIEKLQNENRMIYNTKLFRFRNVIIKMLGFLKK